MATSAWTQEAKPAVAETDARLRGVVDALDAPIFLCTAEGLTTFANASLETWLGGPLGRRVVDTVEPGDRSRLVERWSDAARRRASFSESLRVVDHRGRVRGATLKLKPRLDARGAVLEWVGSFEPREVADESDPEITKVRPRREVRRGLSLGIAENVRDVLWVADAARDRVLYANAAYERVFGRTRAALYEDGSDWRRAIHPDDAPRVGAALDAQLDGTVDEEFRIVRGDGVERWVRTRLSHVGDGGGDGELVFGVIEDITERRELEAQLRATQKMESIGQLAGGIAHDFNNLLTIILACNEELLEELADVEVAREPLLETRLAVQRATSLTRDLLAFSRRRRHEPRVVDLNEVVGEAERMLRRLLGEDVTFRTQAARTRAPVRIDPSQFTSILVNLAVNARHAMPRGGALTIRTFVVAPGEAPPEAPPGRALHVRPALAPTGWVGLEVSDNGSGFGREIGERIFEPFFTTKSAGKGTGLGLAIVHGIVAQCRGHIEVASSPGLGTTFRIYLPPAADVAPVSSEVAVPERRGTERVLLVEDDPAVRRAAARGLEARGYKVLSASDAEEALRILVGAKDRIDVVVTDVVLPKMSGHALVERVMQQWPSVQVLYTSGYASDDVARYGLSLGDEPFLEKPYTPRKLSAMLRELLDR